jgi:hypothetical protein
VTQERIQYTEPLTGTLAEAAEADPLGVPFSPLAQTWQVNLGAEAAEPGGAPGEPARTTE